METISFDKLLLKTAFCCMASDREIHPKEIARVKTLCNNLPLFTNINFEEEINTLITKLNTRGYEFFTYYFDLIKNSNLSELEELTLIDFAIQTIQADGIDEYSEIKFFKEIRQHLKISNERILEIYPNIEQFLEVDIVIESYIDKITKQYTMTSKLPQFELISLHDGS
jgi:uncharacterized tellurite resistance protein B-like protein